MIKRPVVRPSQKAAYDAQQQRKVRKAWAIIAVVSLLLFVFFWRYFALLILMTISGLFTAMPGWFLAFMSFASYEDSYRH